MAVYKTDANLVSLWLLEEVSGTRYDDVGSNDLTDNNTVGSSATCQEGSRSADFESGNSEHLTIADGSQTGLDITGDISLVAWVRLESQGDRAIMSKYNSSGNQRGYALRVKDAGGGSYPVGFGLSGNGSTYTEATGATSLSAATWYHVAAVYNGTDMRIYIDGSLDSNGADNPKSYSSGIYNNSAEFALGVLSVSFYYFDGLIDEAAVFSRALSAQEVSDIYNYGIENAQPMMLRGTNVPHMARQWHPRIA